MQFFHFVIILLLSFDLGAQQDSMLLQPTVMVIPFVKEGQDIRTVFEKDSLRYLRVAMAKVKNALDTSRIKTIDLRATIQRIDKDRILTHNARNDFKQAVILNAAVDIYIEVEAQVVKTSRGNSVTVILHAYDAFSGHSLVNGFGHSPKFYTQNFEKLSEKALDTFLGEFALSTKKALEDLSKNGRSITINIGIAEDGKMDMDSDIGDSGDLLSDVIEAWLEKNAHQSQFNIQGITATKMIINEVKIPRIHPLNNRKYRPDIFASDLLVYLKSLKIDCSRDVQGTNIFITIR